MTLEEKARDVGRTIGQSAEYQALRRADDALRGDSEALDTLRRMEQLRLDAHKALERGERPTEEMERQLDTLLSGLDRIVFSEHRYDGRNAKGEPKRWHVHRCICRKLVGRE